VTHGSVLAQVNVSVPRDVRRNQTSLFAHVFICRRGSDPNPFSEAARTDRERSRNVIYRGVDLTRILPEIKKPHLRFLLRDPPPPPPAPSLQAGGKRILPYWAPRLALFVVTDFSTYAEMNEEHVSPYMLYFFTQGSDSYDPRTRTYVPVLHVDDLGTLQKDLLTLNETTGVFPPRGADSTCASVPLTLGRAQSRCLCRFRSSRSGRAASSGC